MKLIFSLVIGILSLSCVWAQNPAKQTSQTTPSSKIINASQLLRDDETLSADDMQGRGIGTAGGIKAREFVAARFKASGLKSFGDSYSQPFEFANRSGAKISGANVVGYVEGTKNKNQYIVVTAHYDHLGTRNGEIYNGADDDASGTAALFAIAEHFKKNNPSHSIIFVAFDGEESGLRGSRAFVEKPPVALSSIALNINMDMIAHNDTNELYATGTYAYPALKPALEKVVKTAKVKLLLGHEGPNVSKADDWTDQSDQGSFNKVKIPFIYFGVEDHKDYHKPTDDFININQAFYVRAVETILEAVKSFDKDLK
jgi:Zn-dependent M28 family amino/carboxypeptidase